METLSCCALSSALEEALPSLSGIQFKLFFYLASQLRHGPVREGITAIGVRIGAHRDSVRRAYLELLKLGHIRQDVCGAVVAAQPTKGEPMPDQLPHARTLPAEPSPEYATVWDQMRTFQKTIREPLKHVAVEACLNVGKAWGQDGYQVGAALYSWFRFLDVRAGQVVPPRSWGYIIRGLQMHYQRLENARRNVRRVAAKTAAEQKPPVIDIAAPPLPLGAPPEFDMQALARSKELQRKASAS